MELTRQELTNIKGGANSIGTIINSISKIITVVLDLGRTVGSTIRYAKSKYTC